MRICRLIQAGKDADVFSAGVFGVGLHSSLTALQGPDCFLH